MQKNNRVTAGCAAALTHATAACIAGANPEKMQRVPSLAGMSSEVIIPKHSRNVYDHAVRMLGVTIVEVDSAAPPFRERLIRGNSRPKPSRLSPDRSPVEGSGVVATKRQAPPLTSTQTSSIMRNDWSFLPSNCSNHSSEN